MTELFKNDVSLYAMAVLYLVAGISHFVNPRWYTTIIPKWIPNHKAINLISGGCEIILALMLPFSAFREIAAWGIIAFLVAVFPANIQMCINYYSRKNPYFLLSVVRLPLQIILIWWAELFTI